MERATRVGSYQAAGGTLFGQGGPVSVSCFVSLDSPSLIAFWRPAVALLCACMSFAGVSAGSVHAGEGRDLRVHIAWGGGEAKQWSGRVYLTQGKLRDLALLGGDPEQSGTIQIAGQQVVIGQRKPQRYDGLEVTCKSSDGDLYVEFLSQGEVEAHVVSVPIANLVAESITQAIDDAGNRVVIRRLPSDKIRVSMHHEHLVFAPGGRFRLEFEATDLGVAEATALRCQMQIRSDKRRGNFWTDERRQRADSAGSWPHPESLEISLPTDEGVYVLELAISTRRRSPPFRYETIAWRTVQFVVLGDQPIAQAATSRELILAIDPSQANWWQRLTRLPQWKLLPGFRSDGPLGNVETQRVEMGERSWTQLPVGGWQAYPLPIRQTGVVHELEIDFPGNTRQTFSISIVEANAAGKLLPVGLDSAVAVSTAESRGLAVRPTEVGHHRLTFWPRTKSPLLLITNISHADPSQYGRIQVFRKPQRDLTQPATDRRRAIAFFERPLFPEVFGAVESLDAQTGRSLEDWQTFYDGADRMIWHLKEVGYRGVAVTCVSDGTALYPSHHVQPFPKHDRGIFFSSGQDPIRKDVLELLFRMFDREGLVLVPTVEFAAPLPELERILLTANSEGVRLENRNRVPHTSVVPPNRGRAAYYNPLDLRVQRAMQNVIREIVTRYGKHASFGGVAINLRPDGFTQLPDENWGVDPATWSRFCHDRKKKVGVNELTEPVRQEWLDWRCEQLRHLYGQMANEIQTRQAKARLYLVGGRLVDSRPIQRAFRPLLPPKLDIERAMRELGISPQLWRNNEHIVMLRPRLYDAPVGMPAQRATVKSFNDAYVVNNFYRVNGSGGSLFFHKPHLQRLPGFDEVSPFGRSNTLMSLVAHISPADVGNRKRFAQALAQEDAQLIVEGGWMLPMGQEGSLQSFLNVFQQLPAVAFQDVESGQRQPLTIRTAAHELNTYFYVVNDSPWFVGATIDLEADGEVNFEHVGIAGEKPVVRDGDRLVWPVTLAPYDVAALRADRPDVTVGKVEVTLPPDVLPALSEHIIKLAQRVPQLGNPVPLQDLVNAGFEQWLGTGNTPLGWSVGPVPSGVTCESSDVHDGQHAVRIRATGTTVELFSQPIKAPETGQLSVSLRAKALRVESQPRVRMVLRVNGEDRFPWTPIGQGSATRTLDGEWGEFVFRVNQLPPVEGPLQIGVMVDGVGEVLIDNLQLFDVAVLDANEQKELAHLLSLAEHQRGVGLVSDCLRILNSYWPQYLIANVPDLPAEIARQPASEPDSEEKPSSRAAWRERLRQLVVPIRR